MVVHIPTVMEWSLHSPSSRAIPIHLVRRIRFMGLWSNMEWPLVSDPWLPSWHSTAIAPKELVPIVFAITIWGSGWAGQRICCLCDNMAVVFAVNKGSARDPQIMRLLRTPFFCAHYNCTVSACHIAGAKNTSADALSRNNLRLFFSLNLQASHQPTAISANLRELLLDQSLRWTSPSWTRLFNTSLENVLLLQPEPAMPLSSGRHQRAVFGK